MPHALDARDAASTNGAGTEAGKAPGLYARGLIGAGLQGDTDLQEVLALAVGLSGASGAALIASDGQTSVVLISHGALPEGFDPAISRNLATPTGTAGSSDVPVEIDGELVALIHLAGAPPQRPTPTEGAHLQRLAGVASAMLRLKLSSEARQKALAREEQRRGIALAAAGLASWVWDFRHHAIECDPLLPVLFGLPAATHVRARTLFANIDRRDLRAARSRFREAINGSGEYEGEYRVRALPGARPHWLAARGRVVERDNQGRPVLVFGVNFDITQRRETEERQRLLLREINHRVKNTLATVQALASQTVRHARQPREFLEAFSGRLQALGAAHNLLSDGEWRGIAMRDLVSLEVKPFEDDALPRIDASGPDLILPPDQALGLGLILHELASNALKYGALAAPGGRVSLSWRIERNTLLLEWAESGGPSVREPTQHGFGTILIRRSLGKVLGSEVDHRFMPEGVQASVVLPLEEA